MHIPVLLKKSVELLNPEKGNAFIDATIGAGGHSGEILARMKKNAFLLGIDQDTELLNLIKKRFSKEIEKRALFLVKGNFQDIKKIAKPFAKKFDGILFDLGFSSFHIEKSGRGFSFQGNEPLIMTYDQNCSGKLTAKEIVNRWSVKEIEQIFKTYGQERWSRRIAEKICEVRRRKFIETAGDLVKIILSAVPSSKKKFRLHPATRVFQALRIAVNDELNALNKGLNETFDILNKNGRLAVISFHSLEDRIVKNFFKQKNSESKATILTKKPIIPSSEEVITNPRSRSAKLRAIIKK